MTHEHTPIPSPNKPYELFGLTEGEKLRWRVDNDRFEEILKDERTQIHTIAESSNTFYDFLFVTSSRPGKQGCICMSFSGQGFHECRERWLIDDWFWYQATAHTDLLREQIPKYEAQDLIGQHWESVKPHIRLDTLTERGFLFETLADLTDDDSALFDTKILVPDMPV